jgi:hypothetical protein
MEVSRGRGDFHLSSVLVDEINDELYQLIQDRKVKTFGSIPSHRSSVNHRVR